MDKQREAASEGGRGQAFDARSKDLAFKRADIEQGGARRSTSTANPAASATATAGHAFGQSLLLARRLVEAGVAHRADEHGHRAELGHARRQLQTGLKSDLLPPLDRSVSAPCSMTSSLRDLLDETLVIVMGEFGRTPKIVNTGRDHWAQCFSRRCSRGRA